jgi:hypothetical protein
MLETLKDGNVLDRLVLSFVYRIDQLKAKTLRHIVNSKKTIFDSDQWKELMRKNQSLAKEIVEAVNSKVNL